MNGHEYVLVDQLGETFPVVLRVARTVNDPHLLDEGALAALARPCSGQRFKGFNRRRKCCTNTHSKDRLKKGRKKTSDMETQNKQ